MQSTAITVTIGDKVRAGRARLGLTRKQFAAKAEVSERYLNELENGVANASIGILVKVAEALEQTPLSLLTELDTKAAPRPLHAPLAKLAAGMSVAEQSAALPVLEAWLADRRRASKGIALLGLRGAGKSTLGRLLAERLAVPLVSVTREIEERAGMNLADLFNLGGADAYRAIENEVVAGLVAREGRMVLETAGGIAANSEALETILSRFKTVWLKASPEEHLSRVAGQGDLRPMQGNPRALDHLKALLAAREPEYARAEVVIDTSGRRIKTCLADLEAACAGIFPARSVA